MGSLASPALVPGTQQQRPVWVPGFPQMFESQAKGCPRQAQALPPGSCVTLDKSVSASPCPHVWPGQTCPCPAWPAGGRGPGLLWRAVYRAMPGVRAGSGAAEHLAAVIGQGQERRQGWEPKESPVAADLWFPQYVRRSWGLPLHWSPRILISTALSPQGEPRGVRMRFWSSQSLGAGGACHQAAPWPPPPLGKLRAPGKLVAEGD